MTLNELCQLRYLKVLIERDEERYQELKDKVTNISPILTGMPAQQGTSDKVGEGAAALADLARRIQDDTVSFTIRRARMEEYIRCIDDAQLRTILILRFVDGLTWNQVADRIGGNNTEDSVKKACYRYLKKCEE
ncbi:MAG: hypothetical protein PHQ85_07135 [Eubacteriales bacterium]|nr:hypothetical protein [Eubacteriales bacterium]